MYKRQDQINYGIGYRFQPFFRRFVLARKRRRKIVRKAETLLKGYGVRLIIMSRLMGPVAWFAPSICAGLKYSWFRFSIGSFFGVLLGVGLFLGIGYASAWAADHNDFDVSSFIAQHKWWILIGGQLFFFLTALIAPMAARFFFSRTLAGPK